MGWRPHGGPCHQILDGGRVSSLIQAFLELILTICVFLCAIIAVTTTRIIKSSGLFPQTCGTCDHQHQRHRQGSANGDGDGYQKLDSRDLSRNRGGCSSNRDSPTPMNIICEDCTLHLSECNCALKRGSLTNNSNSSPGRCRYEVATSSNSNNNTADYSSSDHTIWATEDDDSSRRQLRGDHSSSSFENVDSSCDSSDRIAINGSTVTAAGGYGCECRTCIGIPGPSSSPSRITRRAVKRKFAKVFPYDSRAGACSYGCDHPAHVLADSASFFANEGRGLQKPGEVRQSPEDGVGGQLLNMDGSCASRFLSDSSEAHRPGKSGLEDSLGISSQESFSYKTRRSGPLRFVDISRNRSKLSIDTDLLGGESTPEWCESLADFSPAVGDGKEMEEHETGFSSLQYDNDDPHLDVMELKEALEEEKEALAAVYLELEEERNAASSAAHETMAMITRLQEEKAAIQMEARQYQRMAEEKQQYDHESMAMLQEILIRRDEEVFALEEMVNLYRNRVLTLGMDETMNRNGGARDRIGSPNRGTDVMLIEQETLLLEGSEDWKSKKDRGDQKLLMEIKEWLKEAREKIVAPKRIEELKVPAGNSDRLLPGDGRKNLLDSFSSVATEDSDSYSDRDGIVIEEFEVREEPELFRDEIENEELVAAHRDVNANEEPGIQNKDTAAGYESFQGMMESLRQEPSMMDEESLKTLKRIEEKFQRQSSQGEGEARRSGDELRQIWKNTLRSFESDEHEDTEAHEAVAGKAESRAQSPATTIETATSTNSSDFNEVAEAAPPADSDRSVGEKRISVLEYVWKFEEQLHQLGNKKPPLSGKSGSFTALDSIPDAEPSIKPSVKGEYSELVDSEKNKKSHWTRLRKLATGANAINTAASDGRSATPDAERDRFVVRGYLVEKGEASPSSERPTRTQDTISEKIPDFEEGSNRDAIVHDVYEVVQQQSSPNFRKDKLFSHDIKKCVSSTVNELIPGQYIDSHETARCIEHCLFDSGRQDFAAGHALEEHEANGKGRPDESSIAGDFTPPRKDSGIRAAQADGWPENCVGVSRESSDGCAPKSLSSANLNCLDSPEAQGQELVQQLTHRLKALETDGQMMPDTIASLRKENGDINLLQDISQHLRELRGMEQTAVNNSEPRPSDDPAFFSTAKVGAALPAEWRSWKLPRRSASGTVPTPSQVASF